MALTNNVQLLTLVHVPVDGATMIVQQVWLHLYTFELIIQSFNNSAICSTPCGTNKQCTAPDNCTCVSGWTGSNCLTGFVYIDVIH